MSGPSRPPADTGGIDPRQSCFRHGLQRPRLLHVPRPVALGGGGQRLCQGGDEHLCLAHLRIGEIATDTREARVARCIGSRSKYKTVPGHVCIPGPWSDLDPGALVRSRSRWQGRTRWASDLTASLPRLRLMPSLPYRPPVDHRYTSQPHP